jgi:hypothetical protein
MDFLKYFAQSKIPTLVLVALVLFTGGYIVVNSKGDSNILLAGEAFLGLGGFLAVVAFIDYRNKEYIDSIITHYRQALESIGKTHSQIEENKQESLRREVEGTNYGEDYALESEPKTVGKS